MDLIREILKHIEKSDGDPSEDVQMNALYDIGYGEPQVFYHIKLLSQAELIEARDDTNSLSGTRWTALCLTWRGHDFLATAKKDTFWEKAKRLTVEKTGGLPFDILKGVLIQLGKSAIDTAL